MNYPLPRLQPFAPDLHVTVVSPEEASACMAEFWSGGELFGFTRLEDGDLVLRIEPSPDGAAVAVSARGLVEALAEATRLLRPEDSR
jgi:hypothetical protein